MGRVFFEEFGHKFEPDVLIISFNNDNMPERETDQSRIPRGITRQIKKLMYKSAIYLGLRKEIVNRQVSSNPSLAIIRPGEKTINRVPITEYKDNIRYFKDYADRHGAGMIVLQMPKVHIAPDYFKALEEAAKENKCFYIDILTQWKGLPPSEMFCPDELHPTAKGHKEIARALTDLFSGEKLVK
jgi:hypothetical protein